MDHNKQHIHFMGISGIGISGIAKIARQKGYTVTGCDNNIDSKHIEELQKSGCVISKEHQSTVCCDPTRTAIVHTGLIPTSHPELVTARSKNIPTYTRAQMLAQLMQEKESIAVAGSHGKTSTTALVAHILLQAQTNPSIVVGGHIESIESNAQHGTGKHLVAEADESDRSLLILPKKYSIVTNIDLEHLETYSNLQDVKDTFLTFINNTPTNGKNIICIDDKQIQSVLPAITTPYTTYGQSKQATIQALNIQLGADSSTFDIHNNKTDQNLGSITLPQAGIHYVINATGSIALALELGIDFAIIKKALSSFSGVDRRFSYKGISKKEGAHIFDDYGHHPLEIDYALQVARRKAKKKLIVVFQPHRYTRTKHLWNDFIKTFSENEIDTLIITDIYASSEPPINTITSKRLIQEIAKKQKSPDRKVYYCPLEKNFESIQKTLQGNLGQDDLLLLLGAGKVNKLAKKLT